ncbi:MAG: hypothetical protein QF579_06810 [Dehalococcoidia bacterium]|nr:hypothetical protein [Dehalococcoidia bacterium]
MRLALLYRIAIPLFLTFASATMFRALILPIVVVAFAWLLLLMTRRAGKAGQASKEGKKFIESSYKIVDDTEEPSKQ